MKHSYYLLLIFLFSCTAHKKTVGIWQEVQIYKVEPTLKGFKTYMVANNGDTLPPQYFNRNHKVGCYILRLP